MKWLTFLIGGGLFLLSTLGYTAERQFLCKVVGISDGDTLTCLSQQNTPLKIRLLYIDAPESAQPFGQKSKQLLAKLAFKKQLKVVMIGYDKYQRILATLFDEQGMNINLKMVEEGLAWAYKNAPKAYFDQQHQAAAKKIGLWQDKNPMNPADWRKQSQSLYLQNSRQNRPLNGAIASGQRDCSVKLTCGQIGSYPLALQYFQQCGWTELDGNRDGIPCNRLYRKMQRQ